MQTIAEASIRLHDLRSRSAYDLAIVDAGISSLTSTGMGYIAAGTYSSMLRLFDIRKAKAHIPSSPCQPNCWDLLMNLRENRARNKNRQYLTPTSSALYSLSSPSCRSTKLYAGLEGAVLQMDFVNAYDKHPDKLFSKGFHKDSLGRINPARTFDPYKDVWNFYMHDAHFKLMEQTPLLSCYGGSSGSLDGRWRPVVYSRRQRF